jgi:hypothetical protein
MNDLPIVHTCKTTGCNAAGSCRHYLQKLSTALSVVVSNSEGNISCLVPVPCLAAGMFALALSEQAPWLTKHMHPSDR